MSTLALRIHCKGRTGVEPEDRRCDGKPGRDLVQHWEIKQTNKQWGKRVLSVVLKKSCIIVTHYHQAYDHSKPIDKRMLS